MTTPYWSDFVPNSTFYRILSGFQITFATGVACWQGTLTPPDTWSRPFRTCICSTCWDQSFSELVVILPDYTFRIFLGTFSILSLNLFFYTSENENPELFKNGGRSAMLQIFPGGRSAMKGEGLQCCKPSISGKVCTVADLPEKVCKGEGLQYNTGNGDLMAHTMVWKSVYSECDR